MTHEITDKSLSTHAQEVVAGQRFEFGANWTRFLTVLNEDRVKEAEESLVAMLEIPGLAGLRFLDAGSGSGLFSLAARRLGAQVHSFDFDPKSVACTKELRRRYFADDANWTIGEGSVLDVEFLRKLGQFDVVYSWGVLHHTGAMWAALANVVERVAPGGRLYISIYNDQPGPSGRWTRLKRLYNRHKFLRFPLTVYTLIRQWTLPTLHDFRHGRPFWTWRNYQRSRGMSAWHDVVDWIGGYPFEVAKPEEIFDFCRQRGFRLERLKTVAGGHGCNEYMFIRT